jgi:lipopolysaccharide export system permease protein
LERAGSFIVENQFMDEFPGYVLYVRKKDGNRLHGVSIYKLSAEGKLEQSIQAANATVISREESNQVVLLLYNLHRYDLVNSQWDSQEEIPLTLDYKPPPAPTLSTNLSDMTFSQLWKKLRDLERLSAQNKPVERAPVEALREQKRRLAVMTADLTMPVRVQIHRQVAFSFGCIGFTLIGIPLGIRAHRRETSAGVAMALILALIYYSFIIVAQSLETRPEFSPHLILWLPNFIFQAVGAVLLWRANRGV